MAKNLKKKLIHLNQNFSSKVIANFIKKILKKLSFSCLHRCWNQLIILLYFQNNLIEFKKFLENIKIQI